MRQARGSACQEGACLAVFQVKDSAAHVNLLIIKGVGHPRHVKRQTVRWDGKIFWRGPASPQTRGPAARGACGARFASSVVRGEGGGSAALSPHAQAVVLPARPRLPHLPPAHRSRRISPHRFLDRTFVEGCSRQDRVDVWRPRGMRFQIPPGGTPTLSNYLRYSRA